MEVVSSIERDGRPVFRDLRWGVYTVIKAPNPYTAQCFRQYGVPTDKVRAIRGRCNKPFPPDRARAVGLGVERGPCAANRRGRREAGGATWQRSPSVNLVAGEMLDGEGGYTVWGKLIPAKRSRQIAAVPIGRKRCPDPTFRSGSGSGLMPAHERSILTIRLERKLESKADEADDAGVPMRRLELITGTGRRRRWSSDEKARILVESLRPGANISEVARRNGLSPQQLFGWRREVREPDSGCKSAKLRAQTRQAEERLGRRSGRRHGAHPLCADRDCASTRTTTSANRIEPGGRSRSRSATRSCVFVARSTSRYSSRCCVRCGGRHDHAGDRDPGAGGDEASGLP